MATHIEIPVIGKVKHPSRWLIGLIAGSALVVGTITTYTLVNQGTNKEDIAQLTVPVAAQNVTLRITASGKVVPVQSVNISPKNPGVLSQLYVEQGDRIQQGQILARMDSASIEAQRSQYRANLAQSQAQLAQALAGSRPQEIAQARARLAQAQAQLAAAKAGNRPQEIAQSQSQVDAAQARVNYTSEQVKRYQYLYKEGAEKKQLLDQAISDDKSARANLEEAKKRFSLVQSGTRSEEIDQRQAAVNEARAALVLLEDGTRSEEIVQRQAAVASAEAQLKGVQVQLEDTIIRAPLSGIVTQKYAEPGAFVTPTTSASTSASATSSSIVAVARGLEILAQVPEADLGRIKQGQQVEIVADAYPDRVFKGSCAPDCSRSSGGTRCDILSGAGCYRYWHR
ncbi:biotin/lipoyl-binding protein [Nostoc sp. DSM 114160]|jgi:HlyD family secretion protein